MFDIDNKIMVMATIAYVYFDNSSSSHVTFWNTKGTNPSILTPKRYVKIPCPML